MIGPVSGCVTVGCGCVTVVFGIVNNVETFTIILILLCVYMC